MNHRNSDLFSLFVRIIGCIAFVMIGVCAFGQDLIDVKEVNMYERKASSFQRQYARSYRQNESNEGAKNLSTHLKNLETSLEGYAARKSPKSQITAVLNLAVNEAGRYNTPQARKTLELLEDLFNFLKTQPEASQSANNSVTDPIDNVSIESDKPLQAQDGEKTVNKSPTQQTIPKFKQDNNNSEEKDSNLQINLGKSSNINESDTEVQPDETLMTIVLILTWIVLLIGGWYIIRQINSLKESSNSRFRNYDKELMSMDLKPAGQGGGGSKDYLDVVRLDFNKKMDHLEKNTSDFIQMLESRLNQLESGNEARKPTGSVAFDAPDLITSDYEKRIHKLEQELLKAQQESSAYIKMYELPSTAQMEALLESLTSLKKQTNLESLKRNADWLADQLKQAEHQNRTDLIDLHLAGLVLQEAHVAAYNEQLDDPYIALVQSLKPLGLIPEDKRPSDMCLPADVATNITLENYTREERYQSPHLPDRPTVLSQMEKKFRPDQTSAGTILNVLQPTIYFEHRGQRGLLCKGIYVVR